MTVIRMCHRIMNMTAIVKIFSLENLQSFIVSEYAIKLTICIHSLPLLARILILSLNNQYF